MAVQQNKKSRSRRVSSSHDALTTTAVSVDKASGETLTRHRGTGGFTTVV